jgi:hypothetical protein
MENPKGQAADCGNKTAPVAAWLAKAQIKRPLTVMGIHFQPCTCTICQILTGARWS